ncbi:sialidase-2-like [Macrotis lagotis]|uniref:sialidase-2-like n=1 Tax=Macrotis lagotis TaxID=92651 RepID=UPI003D698996
MTPALLYLEKYKTLLAFAEQRVSQADEEAKNIVLRRGGFKASTGQVKWKQMEVVRRAQLPDHHPKRPCPVYDEVTGTLFLLFIAVQGLVSEQHQIQTRTNLVRLCCVTSKDNGKTWSPVTDLTDSVIGSAHKEWATFASGPGHGLQLHNPTQSLVIPAYAYRLIGPEKPTPYVFCFLSNDHGKTWEMGNFITIENTLESQMVEVDGHGQRVLYCNSRSTLRTRVQAISLNDGVDFQGAQQIKKLVEPPSGCQGSVVGFPNPTKHVLGSVDTWVLYSHPTDPLELKDLGVYLNRDPLDPIGWTKPAILVKGLCAFSDLQYMGSKPNGSPQLGCLFEYGNYDQILFL